MRIVQDDKNMLVLMRSWNAIVPTIKMLPFLIIFGAIFWLNFFDNRPFYGTPTEEQIVTGLWRFLLIISLLLLLRFVYTFTVKHRFDKTQRAYFTNRRHRIGFGRIKSIEYVTRTTYYRRRNVNVYPIETYIIRLVISPQKSIVVCSENRPDGLSKLARRLAKLIGCKLRRLKEP